MEANFAVDMTGGMNALSSVTVLVRDLVWYLCPREGQDAVATTFLWPLLNVVTREATHTHPRQDAEGCRICGGLAGCHLDDLLLEDEETSKNWNPVGPNPFEPSVPTPQVSWQ